MLKATCPNSPEHKTFITVAHVMQDWLVDEHGNFLEARETIQTDHGPDPGNGWSCATCHADAKVEYA